MNTDVAKKAVKNETDQPEPETPQPRQITLTVPSLSDLRRRFHRTAGGPNRDTVRWSGRAWIAAGLAIVALAAVNIWMLGERQDHGDVESARAAALEEARARVPALLSYAYKTLGEDLDRAKKQTTGDFGDDYANILDDVVEPNARRHQISTEAVVEKSAIVDGDENKVVVLVFLTQTTLSKNPAAPEVTGSRVEVTMVEHDGRWLIAGLEPV